MLTRSTLYFLFLKDNLSRYSPSIPLAPELISKFFRYADVTNTGHQSICDWILNKFGLSTLQKDGFASFLCGDPMTSTREYWMCITPVSLNPSLNDLTLNEIKDMSIKENKHFFSILKNHLAEEYDTVVWFDSKHWCLKAKSPQKLKTTSYHRAIGSCISEFIMTGSDSSKWKRITSEIEILFNQDPLNQKRLLENKKPINSIWLWGVGPAETPNIKNCLVRTRHPFLKNIAKLGNIECLSSNIAINDIPLDKQTKEIIVSISDPLLEGSNWSNSFIENDLKPSLVQLKSGMIGNITLVFPFENQTTEITVNQISFLKFWRYLKKNKNLLTKI